MSLRTVLFDLPKDWSCGICGSNNVSENKRIVAQLKSCETTCNHIFHKNCYENLQSAPRDTTPPPMYAKYCPTCNAGVRSVLITDILH